MSITVDQNVGKESLSDPQNKIGFILELYRCKTVNAAFNALQDYAQKLGEYLSLSGGGDEYYRIVFHNYEKSFCFAELTLPVNSKQKASLADHVNTPSVYQSFINALEFFQTRILKMAEYKKTMLNKSGLTQQQQLILQGLSQGLTIKELAKKDTFPFQKDMLAKHIKQIRSSLGVKNNTAAVAKATRLGVIE